MHLPPSWPGSGLDVPAAYRELIRLLNIRKSLLISFSSSYLQMALQFAASLVIARLLTPEEFGVFSLATVIIYLAGALRNFGVAGYVIQERELTKARLDSAAGLNFLFSWGMAAVVVLIAGPLAEYFKAPAITPVIWLLAANFVLIPFASTLMGCLRREMLFDRVAKIDIAAATVQSGGSVVLAWWGYSFYSMAIASVLATVLVVIMTWVLRPADVHIFPRFSGFARVFRFGTLSTLNHFLLEAGKRMPDFVLARMMDLASLAFFARAGGLIEMFNRLVMSGLVTVTVPHFAAEARNGPGVSGTYLLGTSYLTAVAWPFLVVLAATAPDLVPLLYGGQWGESIPLVQILCLGELLLVPFYLQGQVLVATGHMGVSTALSFAAVVFRVPALVLLAPHGLVMLTIGYAAASLFIAATHYLVELRVLKISLTAFWRALWPSFVVGLCVALGLAAVHGIAGAGIIALGVQAAVALAAWLLGLRLVRHPFMAELKRLLAKR